MRTTGLTWVALSCLVLGACAAGRTPGDDDDTSGAEDCASGYDEDGDHLVDCFDPDCATAPLCNPSENCANLIDDDGDELADCDDPSCAADEACAPEPETYCADERDDDGDGATDCDDSDCAASPACQPVGECGAMCTREADCGRADPDCIDACTCTVEQTLAPEFSTSYYGCMAEADCAIFDDPTPCLEQAEFSSTRLAGELTTLCRNRDDCAGLPCEYFGMFGDDTLTALRTCMQRSDCLTCLDDAASACPTP